MGQRPNESENQSMARLVESEFVFVTGKGGVGKSTVSALIALHAQAQGKRCLLVYPEGSPSAEALWKTKLEGTPRPVAPQIDAIAIEPEPAMRQYVAEVLGSTKLAAVLFHQRIAQGLLTGIPGPSDWAILGKAWSYTKSGAVHSIRKEDPYDLVILDAPASGDGSGMLRVPQVILDLAPAARLRKDAENCLELLRDPKRASVVFVTLVEHLSISETEENLDVVRRDLRMPLGPIFVNQVLSPRFSAADRKRLLSLPEAGLSPELLDPARDREPTEPAERAALCQNASVIQATREALQEGYRKRIDKWEVPLIELPRLSEEQTGKNALMKLQMGLAAGH